jgi:hypothetical protein
LTIEPDATTRNATTDSHATVLRAI